MKNNLLNKQIFFIDWVPYSQRGKWYQEADVVINLHNITKESKYAWRTRIIDFIWGETPIITSGGDEISEMLKKNKAGIILPDNQEASISQALEQVYEDKDSLAQMKENLRKLKPELYWENVTKKLAEFIKKDKIAPDRQLVLDSGQDFNEYYQKETGFGPVPKRGLKEDLKNGWLVLKNNGLKGFFQKLPSYFKRKINS